MLTDEELPPPPDPIADGEGFLDDLYSERQMREYARAVERAAYAAAIKACEASAEHEEEARALQRADAARGGDENEELARLRHLSDVRLFNAGISTCAEAIRSLMQEQPK